MVASSFGSIWWPITRPILVNYLLDSLRESGFPFVFAYSSMWANLSKDLVDKINSYEDSLAVKFAPQWAALDHPATGYFVVCFVSR